MEEEKLAPKTVACPSCKGPSVYAPSNRFRPFCCERCKTQDLGAWASEQFCMPAQGPNSIASDEHHE